ncbi:exo-alpha-sialidase [Nonomuraea sp. K274]|uniref:Exo-alpha-sialidase n=1 Tax=Nonomuraea cypriaca TaxID=1187855 RepID=A0A931EZ01_9ACTN|nr:sialidase family protein [Nonomuraea cypriaca]MBF8184613.1 exo-alpha-sialidase [Nonomuraea cypriaca]
MTDPRFDGVVRRSEVVEGAREAWLPAPHGPDSHAANLLRTRDGDLLCTWFTGPREGHPGTNVALARLAAGADRWAPSQLIATDPERSEQNPVLFDDGTRIWLLHTSSEPYDQTTAHVVARTSGDQGRTWSEPYVLFGEPGIFVRHPPLILGDGTWLLPAYHCGAAGDRSVVEVTTDGGRTWDEHQVPGSGDLVQMTVAGRPDGKLLAMFRDRRAGRIHTSVSADGRTWSAPERTDLPNNDSSVQLTRLGDGRLALVYNDASLERDQFRWVTKKGQRRRKALRTPLVLAESEDGGLSWPHRRVLQEADSEYWQNEIGYSYPCVIDGGDGRLRIAFSYLRKTIKYLEISTR